MKHILDTKTGIVHYEWTKDGDETYPHTVPYCCDVISTQEDYAHIQDTELDVTCAECLHDVAVSTDRTYRKGDLVKYDGMYCIVREIDPTYALIQFECQDGSYSWDVPDDDIERVSKENRPPLFWRMKRTPHLNRMKFWVGRNYGSEQGAYIRGEVFAYNGMTEENAIKECRKMLEGYVNKWQK